MPHVSTADMIVSSGKDGGKFAKLKRKIQRKTSEKALLSKRKLDLEFIAKCTLNVGLLYIWSTSFKQGNLALLAKSIEKAPNKKLSPV